jgi:hypothetical protein
VPRLAALPVSSSTIASRESGVGGNEFIPATDNRFRQQFSHGTHANLHHGDLIVVGFNSNFAESRNGKNIRPNRSKK